MTAMLFQVARAEEESMMTGATVVEDDGRVYSTKTPDPDVLIGPSFKSPAWYNNDIVAEYTIDFGEPKTVHSVFLTSLNATAAT